MKRLVMMAMASGLAIAVATPVSAATLISIGVSFDGGATISTVATDGGTLLTNGSGSANYNTTVGQYFYNISATGFPITTQPDLLTQSVNIRSSDPASSRSNVLSIFITQQGLNAYNAGLMSSFTSNLLSGSTQSAKITSFYSTANALYGGTQLETATFTGLGTFAQADAITAAAPFSTTVRYDLTFGGGNGNFNGTANLIGGPVPEPATWGMMILGFGVAGAAMRRRVRTTKVSFA